MEIKNLVKVLGSKWIFLELLDEKEFYLTEIHKKLDKSKSDCSVQLKKLKEIGLIDTEDRVVDGSQRKYYKLTFKGKKVVDFFKNLDKMTPPEKKNLLTDKRKIEHILNFKNHNFSEEVRNGFADAFFSISDYKIWGHKEIKDLFLDLIKNPVKNGELGRNLMRGYRKSIKDGFNNLEDFKTWFSDEALNTIIEHSKDDKLLNPYRGDFVILLDIIFPHYLEKQNEIFDICLDILLEVDHESKTKRDLYNNVREILLKARLDDYANLYFYKIFDWLIEISKGEDEIIKKKAEKLLGEDEIEIIKKRAEKLLLEFR